MFQTESKPVSFDFLNGKDDQLWCKDDKILKYVFLVSEL